MKIILGSNSKRRKELLDMLKIKYEIFVSDEDEVIDSNLSNLENCQNISLQKAINVKNKTKGDRIIITCDTIVQKNNKLYGKPKDRLDAINMLKMLSNTYHEVISCLTIIKIKDNKEEIFKDYNTCKVYFDNLTEEEIIDWVDNHSPYDKAGSYAIQEEFGKHITKIEGDFYTIVGLPLNKLYNILKKIDE